MRNLISKRLTIFIALFALGLMAAACKPSAEKLNKDGNDHFSEEAYLEALAAYQQALFENPELAEPYYNAANSLYREGAFPEALTLMQEALKFADEDSLTESGFFNMGNSSFNTEDWGSAVEAFKQALLVSPEDQDAKYNLELALQQQQQEEQQEEEEQDQEEQEEESESDQNEEEQDQQGDQSESDQEQQEDESQDGEEQQDQEEPQDNEEQEGEGDPQDSEEEQEDEQEGQGQPQDGENQDQEQPSQVPPPGQRMTEEQARQLLAAIAEESETLQEHLGQIFVAPPIPPVQDW